VKVLRILWFNWRDIKHPEAGGAEVFTHEVMRRLAKKGNELTLFCPYYNNSLSTEIVDGVEIKRSGGKYSVYSKAQRFYKKYANNYDFIVDEINARPFLTAKLIGNKPILGLFHQLIHEEWFYETFFPLNYICYYYLEHKWLSEYKDIPTATVSVSSQRDLKEYGFKKTYVLPEGLSVQPLEKIAQKESRPTLLFIGRMKKHKLPDHALAAFTNLKKKIPDLQMWLIGDGIMRKKLERRNITDVTFYGRINNELKYDLLRRAHLVLMPSVREGWGLVVTEANAMGTPVVAYNVPGLRDSVIDGKTGVLLKENSPESLSRAAFSLLTNESELMNYSNRALSYSTKFSWDNTAEAFEGLINEIA